MYDSDAPKPKEKKKDWSYNFHDFKDSLTWVKAFVSRTRGVAIDKINHDPDIGLWRFYDGEDQVYAMEHSMIDRLENVLTKIKAYEDSKDVPVTKIDFGGD